ncbi:hypothetical protein I4U23_016384 [Adineta vaga]|nr:hypothetical protein I4U23_016384 [Adineta vaga]
MLPTDDVLITGGLCAWDQIAASAIMQLHYLLKVLVADGYDHGVTSCSNSKVFNVTSNTWTNIVHMLSPRAKHTALSTCETYNISSGLWQPVANRMFSRYGYTTTSLSSGKVLVSGSKSTSPGEVYDSTSDTCYPPDNDF